MKKKIYSFHYTLMDTKGTTLDTSRNGDPLSYMEGAGQIIPGLEAELNHLQVGDKRRVSVKAEQAYGLCIPENVVDVPRERFGDHQVKVGERLRLGQGAEGVIVTVTKMTDTHVTLDANHPLAGKDLEFDVEMTEIRDATPDEIEHGHARCQGCTGDSCHE